MVLYYCEYCKKPFGHKNDYTKHIKTHANDALVQQIAIQNEVNEEGRYECTYCKKSFANANTLHNHVEKKCKLSPAQMMRDQQLIFNIKMAKMKDEMEKQQKAFESKILNKIDTMTETIQNIETGPTINIANSTINVIQVDKRFYIHDIKSERSIFDYLSDEQLNHIVQVGGDAVSKLIEYKHYNKDCPENHNIYITKQKADIAKVFIDSHFVDVNIDELLDYLISTSQHEITAILNMPNIKNKLDYKKQRNIYNLQLKIKENSPSTIAMLKEELRKLMKNNAELVIDTFKRMQATLNNTISCTPNNTGQIKVIEV